MVCLNGFSTLIHMVHCIPPKWDRMWQNLAQSYGNSGKFQLFYIFQVQAERINRQTWYDYFDFVMFDFREFVLSCLKWRSQIQPVLCNAHVSNENPHRQYGANDRFFTWHEINWDEFYMSWILHDHFGNNFLHVARAHRHHFPPRQAFLRIFSASRRSGTRSGISTVEIDETQKMSRDT